MPPIQLPDGRIFYMDNRKEQILTFAKRATERHNTSAVIIYDGRSGMGKTTQAIQDGFYCDRSPSGFGLHKIYFHPDDFIEGLDTAEAHSFHLFDEAMVLSNRASMSKLNMTIVKAMSMIRSKKIIVGFCINSIFDLDRNLALSRADVLFHAYGKNITDRGKFAAFFKGADGLDRLKELYLLGKKYYTYTKPRANFIGRFSSRFLVNAKDYEEKKQEGISRSLQENKKYGGRNWMEEVIYKLRHEKGLSCKEIAEMGNISDRQVRKTIHGLVQKKMLDSL